MRDRLTLQPARQPDQAADPDDKSSPALGRGPPQELQTAFLAGMLDRMVTVYLVGGLRLTGKVGLFDPYTLRLQGADGLDSLIFKHAISAISPGAPVVTRKRRPPFSKGPEGSA